MATVRAAHIYYTVPVNLSWRNLAKASKASPSVLAKKARLVLEVKTTQSTISPKLGFKTL